MIDARIGKPRIHLHGGQPRGDAPTRCCGPAAIAHERLAQTGIRTPLGEVIVARAERAGHDRSRGPERRRGRARGERRDARLRRRAGADRRRDRPPCRVVAGGGRRPGDGDGSGPQRGHRAGRHGHRTRGRARGCRSDCERATARRAGERSCSPRRARPEQRTRREIAALLREHPQASTFSVQGALSERFLEGLLAARRRARWARAEDRRGRSHEGVSGAPRRRLVPRVRGSAIEVLRHDRAASDHGQPSRAAVAPLRLAATAGADRRGDSRRAGTATCWTRITAPRPISEPSPIATGVWRTGAAPARGVTWRWRSSRR